MAEKTLKHQKKKTEGKKIEGENTHLKRRVHDFWNTTPCGTFLAKHEEGTLEYFKEIDRLRYHSYPYSYSYLLKVAGFDKYRGKRVLEIGCGVGTDLSQFAKNGALVTGVDLTESAIKLAKRRFKAMRLKGTLRVADAERLPFPSNSFDLVYSFGVLHHTPNTQKAMNEVYRVLKPGGTARIMLYHTISFEYLILLLRKIINPSRWKWSVQEAINYETEMNRNARGPTNPLTKTYTARSAKKFFGKFSSVRTKVYWIRIPKIGRYVPEFLTYPASRVVGWHLIIEAVK